MFKAFFLETRPQFLILDFVLAILGTSIAAFYGHFNVGYALLALLGVLLTHASVNSLNDYYDYKSGIDLAVKRTPFSGGSGLLPSSRLTARQVFWIAIGSLLLAVPIGVFFTLVTGWLLLPLLVVAAICILFYTSVILKTPFPEWAAGLGLGLLPVMGFYFIQTSSYSWQIVIASVPSFILVYNLLFLNEFPDLEADKIGKRKTFLILLGRDKASIWYITTTIAMYVWIVVWVALGQMPVFALIALLTLPLAFKAMQGSRQHGDMQKLVPAMATNVMVVLLTQLLMGIGYVLAIVFG